jgi:hypothetical protein
MKRLVAVLCFSLSALPAMADTAYFTGRKQQMQSASREVTWQCQYNNAGKTFWRTFLGTCPAQVSTTIWRLPFL